MASINILFDLLSTQTVSSAKYNGGAEYTKQIFLALLSHAKMDCKIYGIFNSAVSLSDEIVQKCKDNMVELIDVRNSNIEKLVIEKGIDLFFIGIAQRWFDYDMPKNVNIYCAILDVADIEIVDSKIFDSLSRLAFSKSFNDRAKSLVKKLFFETYKRRSRLKLLNSYISFFSRLDLSRCRFLTISEHSKYSILSLFGDYISNNVIDVFWPPPTTLLSASSSYENPDLAGKKYWLLINAGRREKNALSVIRELDNIKSFYDKYTLVIVGNIQNTIIEDQISNNPNIYQCNYVSRQELEWLYEKASLFIYPSFAEGFGLPPVEAMKYGTPVLASATSSIMEVCGDAVMYFCPYSKLELRARLHYLLEHGTEIIGRKSLERYNYIFNRQRNDLQSVILQILDFNTCATSLHR
jgi:glycosyltransferase involved in cell wall biosynthesis